MPKLSNLYVHHGNQSIIIIFQGWRNLPTHCLVISIVIHPFDRVNHFNYRIVIAVKFENIYWGVPFSSKSDVTVMMVWGFYGQRDLEQFSLENFVFRRLFTFLFRWKMINGKNGFKAWNQVSWALFVISALN